MWRSAVWTALSRQAFAPSFAARHASGPATLSSLCIVAATLSSKASDLEKRNIARSIHTGEYELLYSFSLHIKDETLH